MNSGNSKSAEVIKTQYSLVKSQIIAKKSHCRDAPEPAASALASGASLQTQNITHNRIHNRILNCISSSRNKYNVLN